MPKSVTTKSPETVNAKAKKAAAKSAKESTRSVVHKEHTVDIRSKDNPITEEYAKQLLGWEEEDTKDKKNSFGNKHVEEVSRIYGTKVRCSNNVTNRPIDTRQLATLQQEILRKRWQYNGEPIIVGVTGLILNGQHTLIALVLAIKAWRETPDNYPQWNSEPVIDKLVVFGVVEEDIVVNTMDTCKPRSLADVIYRARYFKSLGKNHQKLAAKMAEHTIKMLWKRTGVHINALGTRQTHAESIAYLESHPKLLQAVKHIYEENDDNKLAKYLSPGYSAAMLYLMGCSATEQERYYTADEPSEKFLDWSCWEKACEFFVKLAAGDASLAGVRTAMTALLNQGVGDYKARWATITKAWNLYTKGKPVTAKALTLKFEMKDDVSVLVEEPLLGGIDVGSHGVEHEAASDPTSVEIEKKTEKARDAKFGKAKNGSRAGKEWAKGDTAWVHTKTDEPYFCTLNVEPYEVNGGNHKRVMVDSADGEWEVDVADLSLKQFEKVV